MLSHCKCSLTPRKSQQQVLDLVFGEKQEEEKLYIVSPPGSGKTLTGLMIAVKMNVPVIVLVPNTAIQMQWIDKTKFFIEDHHEPIASCEPDDNTPVTVLTYQALAQTRDISQQERDETFEEWIQELIDDGESREDALEWLDKYEDQNPERFKSSLLRRWKNKRLGTDSEDGIVTSDSLELMKEFARRGVGFVIFDECHHLLGYWAQVAIQLVKTLGHPRILGLTATPPAPDDLTERELELHRELLRDIDYSLPTPAVVKDGHLAPYQDLAYFMRPTERELEYIRNCSKNLSSILSKVEEFDGKRLSMWLIEEVEKIPPESMTRELRRRSVFIGAAVRYLKKYEIPVPKNLANFADGPLNLEEIADLLGRYAAKYLLVSKNEMERDEFRKLSRAFRPLGFQLTEKGLRRCQSTVSRILALSQSKMDALVRVLTHEIESQYAIRAIVVTDFEKSSAIIDKDIEELLTDESGGAVAAMRALTSNEITDRLDPILVTGKSVIVDDDLLPRFFEETEKWFLSRGLYIEAEAVPDGGFYRIHGKGKDWNTRNYVRMITEFFERGITHCLVGTRGLLGEGWDSLCANTLIDLTTAATDMTVNQLRGRAIRLNPEEPLNDSPQAKSIKPETREKILSLAKSMGYRRNAIARAMITGKTRTLGFISPPPKSHHLSNMLSGVLAATEELDYSIKYMETSPENPPEKLIDRILEQRLDGVLIQSYSKLRPLWKLLIENRIPMGAMGNSYPFKKGLRVISDDIAGGVLAVKHFAENGHKKIGYIHGGTGPGTGKMRWEGYIQGCEEYGLLSSMITTLNISKIKSKTKSEKQNCDNTISGLIQSHPGITGLYCSNTYQAVTIIKSLRRIGYKVPKDISIIAYSLSDLNWGFDPQITAIDQSHFSMGYSAGKKLIEFIDSDTEELFNKLTLEELPVKLFEGESVRRLN